MKKRELSLFLIFFLLSLSLCGQLGGYVLIDFLSSIHPNGCTDEPVLSWPDNETWVNMNSGSVMTGNFFGSWSPELGNELLLETSFNRANYNVRLILSTGDFSSTHNVQAEDWIQLEDITWSFVRYTCTENVMESGRYILPLDFETHFDLGPTDIVTGIEITFLFHPAGSDLAGVYIINTEPCNLNLGNDTTLCEGEVYNLDATSIYAEYLWQDGSEDSTILVSEPGVYSVTVTGNGCTATDSIAISFAEPPDLELVNDTALCEGDTLLLEVDNPNLSLTWPDGSSGSTYSVSESGTYPVNATDGICFLTDSVQVVFNPIPDVDLGNDTILCEGELLLLETDFEDATYLWSDNSTNAQLEISEGGVYWLSVTENNCNARDSIVIDFSELPEFDIGNDTTICLGDTLILDAFVQSATYLWQDNSTESEYVVTDPGIYWASVTSIESCTLTDSINVVYFGSIDLGNDTTLCEGEILFLNIETQNASYLWSDGSSAPSLEISEENSYWVNVTVNRCVATDTIVVGYNPTPEIDLGNDSTFCEGDTLILSAQFGNSDYLWQDNSTQPTLAAIEAGTYFVTVTLDNCTTTDLINLETEDCRIILEMPNIFTPNSDGRNDLLRPLLINGVDEAKLIIYNRWGEQVFQTNDLAKGWNGRNDNSDCAEGTYFWVVEYQTREREIKNLTGPVTLKR